MQVDRGPMFSGNQPGWLIAVTQLSKVAERAGHPIVPSGPSCRPLVIRLLLEAHCGGQYLIYIDPLRRIIAGVTRRAIAGLFFRLATLEQSF